MFGGFSPGCRCRSGGRTEVGQGVGAAGRDFRRLGRAWRRLCRGIEGFGRVLRRGMLVGVCVRLLPVVPWSGWERLL